MISGVATSPLPIAGDDRNTERQESATTDRSDGENQVRMI